jgi:membrane protein
LTAVALLFVGPGAARTLEQQLGLGGILSFVWSWLRYPLILAVLVVVSALAYSLLPNGLRFRLITVGSVAAVALWLLTSFGFRLYISNFGRYNLVYGSIGAVIVLLIYLYLCAIALLLGAELNAVTGVRDDIGDQPTVREGSAP